MDENNLYNSLEELFHSMSRFVGSRFECAPMAIDLL